MKRPIAIAFFMLFAAIAVWPQAGKTVDRIRQTYSETAEMARLAEDDPEHGQTGTLVMNELKINSLGHQWRAVGIYQQRYRFFYRGGDSENHLYPDELVMVKAERKVSNRSYYEEYLFDRGGSLIFYFQKAENDDREPAERRIYFAAGKAVRIVEDERTRDQLRKSDIANTKNALATAAQIKICFRQSIKL